MNFQKRALYRLQFLHRILSIFISTEQISVKLQISMDFLKRAFYHSVSLHENFNILAPIMIFPTKAIMNEADFSGFCGKKPIKLHICSFSVAINTKLEIYQDSRANRATFVWSNWSKNSPVETISTKINDQME